MTTTEQLTRALTIGKTETVTPATREMYLRTERVVRDTSIDSSENITAFAISDVVEEIILEEKC